MAPKDSDHQDQTDGQDQASAATASGVGGVLRATRLRIGEDLREVAKTLHIRFIYLQAIEDGRYQDLPGAAYALGFIRSYADYLGLDSGEVIRRFKSEAVPQETESADLVFPVPIPESSVPGGAFVFIGLVIAVLAYGGWYASTAKNGFFADLISPLPDSLSALLPGDKATKSDAKPAQETATAPSNPEATGETAPATVVEVPGPTSVEPAPQVVEQAAPKQAVAEPAVTEQANKAAPETVTTAVDQPAVQEPKVARSAVKAVTKPGNGAAITKNVTEKSVPGVAPKNSPAPVAESSPKGAPKIASQTVEPKPPSPAGETVQARHVDTAAATKDVTAARQQATIAAPTQAAPERKPEPTPKPVPETVSKPSPAAAGIAKAEVPKGRVYGVKDGNFRIEVKAIKNSWIQVRDDVAKTLILTRLLRRGDSYRVPDRKGLKLLTGNAGGIEILVDGKAAPSIGGLGVVRRDVALDPQLPEEGRAALSVGGLGGVRRDVALDPQLLKQGRAVK